MSVRISSKVDMDDCPECGDMFEAVYEIVDAVLDWQDLRKQLGDYGISFTEAGNDTLVISPSCSEDAQAVLRWGPKDAIIQSWDC